MKTLIIFFLFISSSVFSQWQNVDGLCGGNVSSVNKFGNYLFAGTSGAGMFSSSDSGQSWEECNNGITNFQIKSLTVDSNNIYCGTYGGGIFKSGNNGASWTQLNNGFLPPFISKILFLNNKLTAVTINGLFQLVNNQWTEITFATPMIYDFASKGNVIFAISSQYLHKSTNNGLNWYTVLCPANTSGYTSLTIKGDYAYTVCNLGVYRVHLDSMNLRYYDLSLSASYPSYIYSDSNSIYVAAKSKVYRAMDGGAFTEIYVPNLSTGFVPSSIFSEGNNLFIAADKGVLHSLKSGINWSFRNNGLKNITIRYISFGPNEVFAASDNLTVYRSYPSDNQWSTFYYEQSPFYNTAIYCIERKNSNTLFIGKDYGGSLLWTQNNGASWTRPQSLWGQPEFYNITFSGNYAILAGSGIYTFNPLDKSYIYDYSVSSRVNSVYNYESGFLACADSGVFRFKPDPVYPDEFVFDTLNTGLASHHVFDVTLSGNNLYCAAQDGIYKTDRNNINWIKIFSTINNSSFFKILSINNILVTASSTKIFTSLDNGNTWNTLYTAPERKTIKTIRNNSEYLYASVSNYGLIKRPLTNLIGVASNGNEIPVKYILKQNYPNPFNPTTMIRYDLPKADFVKLRIFDAAGKEIFVLVNGYQKAGSYEFPFDGTSLASGMYFYTIETGNFMESRKMILLK